MKHDHLLPATEVSLSWPVQGQRVLNSPFGPRQLGSQSARYDWHRGIDLALPMGTTLYAPADAEVVHAGDHPNYRDTLLQLRHTSQQPYIYTLYLHLQEPLVEAGDFVRRGDPVALSGQGAATYPHLHWEVRNGCLLQVCCENPYGYLELEHTPPPPPRIVASGDSNQYGRMLLLGFEFPKDEIDFGGVELSWGGTELGFDLDSLNALAPRTVAAALDNPLYFAENFPMPFVILPKRFNSTFPNAAYEVLFWQLDTSVDEGNATVMDAAGLMTADALSVNQPPISIRANDAFLTLNPRDEYTLEFRVENTGSTMESVTFSGTSAQSAALTITPQSATSSPGGWRTVTVEGSLINEPENVGDAVLLRANVAGGDWDDALGVSFLSTTPTEPAPEGMLAY
ncbi:MAG: M23 family metallopeptidase [Candidatus Sumerlaeia bacterium]|nr:M23 family metallopeptidase [Candidatus Sumerlaeia bacterium]